ncbi:MAG: carboxypeptidase regulatory-like domain-containing protein, partial [Candidatus Colwellbacteria bacterium]|nr:carboxypeptidase regulatory-like domain-containing protein [Candidatus Colwellbacteria bacterium]
YMVYTDQAVTIGTGGSAKEFVGKSMPERVIVSGATTYDFTLTSATSGTAVTIAIDGPSGERLDIFAGSPSGFKAKQVTLDSNAGAESFTLNLADGSWYLGVGPQMPKGPMAGPPPAPNYAMPRPKEIKVASPNCTVDGVAGCSAAFTLTTMTKTIKGMVKDGSSKVIANAEIYAYSPNGGYGTHAQSDTDGAFTLNVADGSYIVGSFVPGMPPASEVSVTVTSHATAYLLIGGATTAITPAAAATSFVLKVTRPDYTISGKITDGTNAVQGASVYAYRSNGPGGGNANTDSSGNYTLYVNNGTWKVGAFIPQYGQLAEATVVVADANVSNQNFSPSQTGTFQTVSGTVTQGGTPVQGAFVKIRGNSTSNETTTASDGTYRFKVPEGNGYILSAFIPGVGEAPPLAAFNVSGSAVENKNFTVGAARTITVTFSASVTEAFVELMGSTSVGNRARITNATSGTLQVPNGDYTVRVGIPGTSVGIADVAATNPATTTYSSTTGIMTVDSNEGLTVTLPTLRTVTGTVTDGTNNVAEAWVELAHPSTGVHVGTKTAANGSFTVKVADSSTAYMINAMKPGYFREPTALMVSGGNPLAQTLTLGAASRTISGTVLIGATTRAANAFIRAEKQGGGFSGTQADSSGSYTLSVSEGIWKIFAVAEGYAETALASNPVDTTVTSAVGKDITLSATVSLNAPKSKPITPSSGGTLEDTTAGVKLTIPANAMGTSTSAGNLNVKETNNVRSTSSATPVANKAKEITATDSSGNPVTNLNGEVTVEMTYTRTELATTKSTTDSSINTLAEAEQLKMAYWDETTSNWVTIPSAVSYKDTNGAVITDLTAIDTTAEFAATVATVTVSAPTTHFSLYAPVSSTGTLPPGTPTGFAATAASASQINLSWSVVSAATSYDIYRSPTSGGTFTRLGSEPTVSSGSTTTYSDTGLTASTAYYYKITALNATGESEPTSAATATTQSGTAGGGSSGGGGGGSSYVSTPAASVAVTAQPTPAPAVKAEEAKKSEAAVSAAAVKVPTMADVDSIKIPALPAKPTVADLRTVLTALQQKLVLLLQMKVAGTLPAPAKAQGKGEGLTKAPAPQAAPQAKVMGRLVRGLDLGAQGDDVRALQEFLKSQGAEVYPEGVVSGYFGEKTRSAVGRFQLKHGLVPNADHPAYGYAGPSTRAKLNELMGQ